MLAQQKSGDLVRIKPFSKLLTVFVEDACNRRYAFARRRRKPDQRSRCVGIVASTAPT
jgi:hypothetical protein